MNRKSSRAEQDEQQLFERAAEWLNVLEVAGPEERAEFMDWVGRSPRHLEEFLLASAVAQEVKRIDLEHVPLVQERLATVPGNVAHLPIQQQKQTDTIVLAPPSYAPSRRRLWSAACAASAVVATVAATLWLQERGDSYSTTVGEQRTIELTDGSTLHMNTGSRVEVHFSDTRRDIRLLEGEVLFDVARDATRPFRVQSGASVIQAVGTQFNVLRRPLGTTVAVLEGVVQISREHSARLTAGEEARLNLDGQIEQKRTIDIGRVAQWRQHRLEFRTEALADIAAQFNRYNVTPKLVVIGEDIKARHYSGMFDADDPRSLIEYLGNDPQLALEQRGKDWVIRSR